MKSILWKASRPIYSTKDQIDVTLCWSKFQMLDGRQVVFHEHYEYFDFNKSALY